MQTPSPHRLLAGRERNVDVLLHELREGLQCRNPVQGTARDQAGAASAPESEGGGDGVGRPFSYQGDVTAPGGGADPREDGGTRPMAAGGDDLYADGPR